MKNKGQTVLEFLFLILIIIIYLTTMVVPMAKDTQKAVTDTESVARANNETQKLANAIQKITLLGEGSRQTVDVFMPENAIIRCFDKNITFDANLRLPPYPAQCPTGTCTKTFATQGTDLDCVLKTISGPSKTSVRIEKSGGRILFTTGS